jgi:hypothetical protein
LITFDKFNIEIEGIYNMKAGTSLLHVVRILSHHSALLSNSILKPVGDPVSNAAWEDCRNIRHPISGQTCASSPKAQR